MERKRVSLVLGSGGARGLAHIGVIECLEARGYDIRYISGASMGALVGGIYAAGKLNVYRDWVCELDRSDVVRLLDWSFSRSSIFKGDRIVDVMRDLIGDCDIKDLSIGFTAVATDLATGREVWLNEGSLFAAIRASIAIPAVFAPVEREGRILADGGLVNPVPIAPTLNDDTDLTIAVNLSGPAEQMSREPPRPSEKQGESIYRAAINRFIDSLFLAASRDHDIHEIPSAMEVMARSLDTMQAQIARFRTAAYNPHVVINIPRNICTLFEFHRARELIEFGRERAGEALDRAETRE